MIETRFRMPERFRPIQLQPKPGDFDDDFTATVNRRTRLRDTAAAARRVWWLIALVAGLAAGVTLFAAWLLN